MVFTHGVSSLIMSIISVVFGYDWIVDEGGAIALSIIFVVACDWLFIIGGAVDLILCA